MKKKILTITLSICILLSYVWSVPLTVSAYDGSKLKNRSITDSASGLLFDLSTGTVTGYTGKPTKIIIPSTIQGVTVVSIGDGAFAFCSTLTSVSIPASVVSIGSAAFYDTPWYKNQKDEFVIVNNFLIGYNGKSTKVTIPNTVKDIGDGVFNFNESITSVIIPNSVKSIGNSAFSQCPKLSSITIPSSVTKVGSWAFEGTPWLKKNKNTFVIVNDILIQYKGTSKTVSIPGKVTTIGPNAFNHSKITSVTIPNGVRIIDDGAFAYCSFLTSVTLPNTVTSIGYNAFLTCEGLTKVNLSNGLKSIGESAFQNCPKLSSISLPAGLTSIGDYAFAKCKAITSITIPGGVKNIGKNAFEFCHKLTSVTMNDGVTSIGSFAFDTCENLTSVTIPNTVTTIGEGAFSDTNIKSIIIPNSVTSIGQGAFSSSALSEITIPSSINSISDHMFHSCSALTSVIVPKNITSIGEKAFYGCRSLDSVTIPSSVTSIGRYSFAMCSETIKIYGEEGSYAQAFAKTYAVNRPIPFVASAAPKIDWSVITPIVTATGQSATSLKVTNDAVFIYFHIEGSGLGVYGQIHIDSDNNSATGYIDGMWTTTGIDYMTEKLSLYRHPLHNNTWKWKSVGTIDYTVSNNATVVEVRVARTALKGLGNTIKIGFKDVNSNWVTVSALPTTGELPEYKLK
jgi:hypothetical protein